MWRSQRPSHSNWLGLIGFDTINKIVHHEKLEGLPFILETPWIGKDAKTQRPMYEVEIALLRGNVAERFGAEFVQDVETLREFLPSRRSIPVNMYLMSGSC